MTAPQVQAYSGAGTEAPHESVGRSISALAVAQVVTIFSGLIAASIVPRRVGPSVNGYLTAAASVTSILGLVVSFVSSAFVARQIVLRPADTAVITGNAVAIRMVMIPIFAAGVLGYVEISGLSAYLAVLYFLMGVATVLPLLTEPIQAAFQAREKVKYLGYVSVLIQVSRVVGTVAVVLLGFRAWAIAGAAVGAGALSLLFCMIWARRYRLISSRLSWSQSRRLIVGCPPYTASSVVFLVYLWIDSVVLSILAPARVVGWYGACMGLVSTLLFVPTILNTVLFPRQMASYKVSPEEFWIDAKKTVEVIGATGLIAGAATAVAAQPGIRLLFGTQYGPAIPVMVLLGVCLLPLYLGIAVGQMHIAMGRPNVVTCLLVVGIGINTGLNLLLIPYFQRTHSNGALGAALSLLATEVWITTVSSALLGLRRIASAALGLRMWKAAVSTGAFIATALILRPLGLSSIPLAVAALLAVAWAVGILTAEERKGFSAAVGRLRGRRTDRLDHSARNCPGQVTGSLDE